MGNSLPNLNVNLEGMNILNQIVDEYPQAISFASGRPHEQFYNLLDWGELVKSFAEYYQQKTQQCSLKATLGLLGQYGKTTGIINELIAEMLHKDEAITAAPGSIVVTCGAQEAMVLCLLSLCREPGDAVLVCDPTYVGITGAAAITRTPIVAMTVKDFSFSVSQVEKQVIESRENGLCVKVLYLVPNFDNPTGNVIPYEERHALLSFCNEHKIVIIEDNPYGLFRYDGNTVKNLKSIDEFGCVAYAGSFSKTLSPSVRVGFLVLPNEPKLIQIFSQAKSFITLNTPQYNQAIVGGFLLNNECSLKEILKANINFYENNRNILLGSFRKYFLDLPDQLSWNNPEGGFFIVLKLPFEFDVGEMELCARQYGVIVVPISCLSMGDEWKQFVRFSFSYIDPEEIDTGVQRFRSYIERKLGLKAN